MNIFYRIANEDCQLKYHDIVLIMSICYIYCVKSDSRDVRAERALLLTVEYFFSVFSQFFICICLFSTLIERKSRTLLDLLITCFAINPEHQHSFFNLSADATDTRYIRAVDTPHVVQYFHSNFAWDGIPDFPGLGCLCTPPLPDFFDVTNCDIKKSYSLFES